MDGAAYPHSGNSGQWLILAIVPIAVLTPLVMAPWWSLYFDVVPKIALILFGAALLLFNFRHLESPVAQLLGSAMGRILAVCLAVQALSLLVSAGFSRNWAISLFGTGWRRLGAIEYIAILLLAFLAAAFLAADSPRLLLFLRGLCVSALALGLYGILQYLGRDPFLDPESYRLINGTLPIVRPPGTLGHAAYFANYLVFLVFAIGGLAIRERSKAWRIAAVSAVLVTALALALTGTRAGLFGLAAGGLFFIARTWRNVLRKRWIRIGGCVAAIALAGFCFTPVARSMRERWRLDPVGGTRLLVWRDSLRMAQSAWIAGTGPETFALVFPRYESLALAKAFPDSYHESSHNVLLDGLLSQGVTGPLALLALGALAIVASFRWSRDEPIAIAFAAGTIALLVSQQFTVFIVPTALAFYLSVAILAAGAAGSASGIPAGGVAMRTLRAAALPVAALFLVVGAQILYVDLRWAAIRRSLDMQQPQDAMGQYSQVAHLFPPETGAALWYSRALLDATSQSPDSSSRRQAGEQALDAATRAVEFSEERPVAWYNLALIQWSLGDASQSEISVRAAIDSAPRWFKPHWLLTEVLLGTGRPESARTEAALAISLGGPRNELQDTLRRIGHR